MPNRRLLNLGLYIQLLETCLAFSCASISCVDILMVSYFNVRHFQRPQLYHALHHVDQET